MSRMRSAWDLAAAASSLVGAGGGGDFAWSDGAGGGALAAALRSRAASASAADKARSRRCSCSRSFPHSASASAARASACAQIPFIRGDLIQRPSSVKMIHRHAKHHFFKSFARRRAMEARGSGRKRAFLAPATTELCPRMMRRLSPSLSASAASAVASVAQRRALDSPSCMMMQGEQQALLS